MILHCILSLQPLLLLIKPIMVLVDVKFRELLRDFVTTLTFFFV